MTRPRPDNCRFPSAKRGAPSPAAAPFDAVPPQPLSLVRAGDQDELGCESTWLLLDAAERMESLGADARATSRRAAEAAADYLFMADRLRQLASSAPDGPRH